jgi:hypothetical protein
MSITNKVKLPLALQQLIVRSNQLLQNYRDELMSDIETSSQQMMLMLNLNPSDGWELDMENMVFVQTKSQEIVSSENEQ